MGQLFGSSGIRGPYPEKIGIDLAARLGAAAGSLAPTLLVGHDVRLTAPVLSQAFMAGALAQGARVTFAGGAPTPSLAYGARNHAAAVVVTASHNPAPDNGFKFWNPDGSAWSPSQEETLEAALDAPPARPEWARLTGETVDPSVTETHLEAILRFAPTPSPKPVVVDCGNGAGSWIAPALLARAGLQPIELFCEPDGRFPNRPSEPSSENLTLLRSECRSRAAWGVAHDGDADRMVLVDPDGEVVAPDAVLVALALLRNARRLATPIDCSLALAKALPDARIDLTKVGDAAVSATLRVSGGDIGGESSGTYVVPAFDLAPDGPLAAVLALCAADQGLVKEARQRLGVAHRRSEKVPLGTMDRHAFSQRLGAAREGTGEHASRVDGLRLDSDAGFVLVRPSGTEPLARITVEAHRAPDLEPLLERGRALVAAARGHGQAD